MKILTYRVFNFFLTVTLFTSSLCSFCGEVGGGGGGLVRPGIPSPMLMHELVEATFGAQHRWIFYDFHDKLNSPGFVLHFLYSKNEFFLSSFTCKGFG